MSINNSPMTEVSNQAQRIKKGVLSYYLLALPAIALIIIFKIIPFFGAITMSFQNYRPRTGIFKSEWVGFSNFSKLFSDKEFTQALQNTLSINIQYLLGACLLAVILAVTLSYIKGERIRKIFTAIFLIPYFIPGVFIAYIIIVLLNPGSFSLFNELRQYLAEPGSFRLIVFLVETIRSCGIPVIIALAAIYKNQTTSTEENFWKDRLLPAIKVIAAFALIQLSVIFTGRTDFIFSITSPAVSSVGQVLDTYIWIQGSAMGKYSLVTAAWLLRFLAQFGLAILIYYVIKKLFTKDLFTPIVNKTDNKNGRLWIVGAVIASLYSLVIVLFLISPVFAKEINTAAVKYIPPYGEIFKYFLLTLMFVAINTFVTITLAYPFIYKNLPGRKMYNIFLIFILCIGSGSLYEMLYYRNLYSLSRYINYLPYLLTSFYTIINVFVIKAIYSSENSLQDINSNNKDTFLNTYLKRVSKPIISLAGIQFALIWSSFASDFFRSISREVPLNQYLVTSVWGFGIICLIPSILILATVIWFGDYRIFVGQARR